MKNHVAKAGGLEKLLFKLLTEAHLDAVAYSSIDHDFQHRNSTEAEGKTSNYELILNHEVSFLSSHAPEELAF